MPQEEVVLVAINKTEATNKIKEVEPKVVEVEEDTNTGEETIQTHMLINMERKDLENQVLK